MKSYKTIAILGSTGSIGKTVLKIINKDKKKFKILLLTANENYKELLKQTRQFEVRNVIITNKNAHDKFVELNKNPKIKIFNDFKKIRHITSKKIDYSMSSIVGLKGLEPTIELIRCSKVIAIANKESIICGWNIIDYELKKNNTKFIPVDSEHFSIWYSIFNSDKKDINSFVDQIILTASGGSLLNLSNKDINKIKMENVLNHPNWKMGNKITVDSSTLMNKVFEVIEAKNIFKIKLNKISILIHPKSYVHAIIKFNSGMIKIIAHDTTMDIPIFNSIYQGKKKYNIKNNIDINKLNKLNLQEVELRKFPLIKILKLIPEKISLYETVIVSANDELVNMYLKGVINYKEITIKLFKFIQNREFIKLKKKSPKNLSDIIKLDRYVRLKLNPKSV